MTKLKHQIPHTTEFSIYKDCPFRYFFYLVPFCIFGLFLSYLTGPTRTFRHPPSSLKEVVFEGIGVCLIWFLPMYLSALMMRLINKPILKFNAQGFYYTPQLWSKRELYLWGDVKHIQVERYTNKKETETKIFVTVHLLNQDCVSIDNAIIPIEYTELLQIFRYRLKDIDITY